MFTKTNEVYVEVFIIFKIYLQDSLAAKRLRHPRSTLCDSTLLQFPVILSEHTAHLLFLMDSGAVSLCAHSLDEKRIWSERVYINPLSL